MRQFWQAKAAGKLTGSTGSSAAGVGLAGRYGYSDAGKASELDIRRAYRATPARALGREAGGAKRNGDVSADPTFGRGSSRPY
jgi:hypothetical protein